jgi:hypothetical protein
MANFAETMLFSHNSGPLFDCAAFNFDGIAAAFAD